MSEVRIPGRATLLLVVTVVLFLLCFPFRTPRLDFGNGVQPFVVQEDWNARRSEVRDAFVDSWDAYAEHAWG